MSKKTPNQQGKAEHTKGNLSLLLIMAALIAVTTFTLGWMLADRIYADQNALNAALEACKQVSHGVACRLVN